MKTLLRIVTAAAVFGATLAFTGCSTRSARRPQVKVVEEFAVVESSTARELTPAQLAELREAVIKYLQEQGLGNNRIYYVRVTFPTTSPDEAPQWAVVRIGNLSTRNFTVLAAYPGADDFYPSDYYRTGYYSSFGGFSRWGYYDPFDYNYGYYTGRPVPPRDHGKPDDKPGDKPKPPAGTHARWDGNPRDHGRPDDKPGDKSKPPTGAHTRWDGNRRDHADHPRGDHPPRDGNTGRWGRDRADNDGGRSRSEPSGGHSYTPRPARTDTPPPERSYTPPPERSYSPPPTPASSTVERVETSTSGIRQPETIEKEK